jgi:biopolymer transport protein ExbB
MLELFLNAGEVAWPLGLCSILALGVVIERLIVLGSLRSLEDKAVLVLELELEKGDAGALNDRTLALAPVVQVLNAIAPARNAGREYLLNAAEVALGIQRARLRRYLGTLATIGATTPFIGLFGTVMGILRAFEEMSRASLTGEGMARGISEALSATALGLLVAVPSVIFYNYFVGRVQAMLLGVQSHLARVLPLMERVESGERS